jgi:hypothetical protein
MNAILHSLLCNLLAASALSGLGCGTMGTQPATAGRVHHVVLCWLKNAGDAEARERIVDVSKGFADIPGVVSVKTGPALPSDRAGVDSSFDVAVVIVFDDRRAMTAYLEHPQHKRALDRVLKPLVAKIAIYDFVER